MHALDLFRHLVLDGSDIAKVFEMHSDNDRGRHFLVIPAGGSILPAVSETFLRTLTRP